VGVAGGSGARAAVGTDGRIPQDLPTGRPGDTHNGLRFAAVLPSGGWRYAGPPVAAPAFAGLPTGGEFEMSGGYHPLVARVCRAE